jgi:hypothetical protein
VAQICTPDYDDHGRRAYIVNTQSDLDMIAAECTTVNGSISVGTNYTGSFSLPNVRNISNIWWEESRPLASYIPAPTSMDLPDLEVLGYGLYLDGLPTLANFSAPKLKTVYALDMDYVQTVDLRSVEEPRFAGIKGNITR